MSGSWPSADVVVVCSSGLFGYTQHKAKRGHSIVACSRSINLNHQPVTLHVLSVCLGFYKRTRGYAQPRAERGCQPAGTPASGSSPWRPSSPSYGPPTHNTHKMRRASLLSGKTLNILLD